MNHRLWWLVLVLAGCDVTTLFATDGAHGDRLSARGSYRAADTLIVGRNSDAHALDPARPKDQESAEAIMQIYDRLVHLRPGRSEPEPALAVSWKSVDAGRSWEFELRRGVRFHDGTPFNADAVVLSFERQRDPQHRYHDEEFFYWRHYFANVVSVEKLDEYRVRINLEREYGPFLANMSIFSMSVVSPKALAEYGQGVARHPVGTGPFKFVSWTSGQTGGRLVLERNDDYWGRVPRFRRLVFKTIEDPRQRMTALVSGSIDIALNMPPEARQFVQLHPHLYLHQTMENAVTYLAMNTTRAPFHDVRVRRAINMAINKQPMVRALWHGSAKPADTPVPPSVWGHYELPAPYRYNPGKARALLDTAVRDGTLDPTRSYRLFVPTIPRQYLPNPERLARGVQSNLEDIGLQVEVFAQPHTAHAQSVQRGEHELCIDGWVGDTGDPDNFLYLLLAGDNADAESGVASNLSFFRNAQVDGELKYAQESIDPRERTTQYQLVQKLVHDLAPWVPLAHSSTGIAVRSDIEGVVTGVSGLVQYNTLERRGADEAPR